MNNEFASIPLDEVDVILLLKITGPSNSEMIFESGPPSTRIDRLIEASRGEIMSNPTLASPKLMSSPVVDGIGVSKTSS